MAYEVVEFTEVDQPMQDFMDECDRRGLKNNAVIEKATFSNVRIILPAPATLQPYKEYLGSHIETLEVSTGKRRVEFTDWSRSLQAPNWMPDGKSLLFNSEGLILLTNDGDFAEKLQRREDIPRLARHFLARAAEELGGETKVLLPETESYISTLPWPGNVRQLENVCRWLTVMASGQEILVSDLPPELLNPVEEQVVALFSGVKGYLDPIPTNRVVDYEKALMAAIRSKGQDILTAIRTDKEIKPETETKLKSFLDDFGKAFQ